MRFDIKTKASPEQVLRALTDFTDARLQICDFRDLAGVEDLEEHGPVGFDSERWLKPFWQSQPQRY